jgi:hypothetical protein
MRLSVAALRRLVSTAVRRAWTLRAGWSAGRILGEVHQLAKGCQPAKIQLPQGTGINLLFRHVFLSERVRSARRILTCFQSVA